MCQHPPHGLECAPFPSTDPYEDRHVRDLTSPATMPNSLPRWSRKPSARKRAHRADRLRELHQPGGDGSPGFGADQQVRRRLSAQALLRRRASTSISSSNPSTAPQLFGADYANVQPHAGSPGQRRGLPGPAVGRRHHPRHEPGPWRPPDPRRQRLLRKLYNAVQYGIDANGLIDYDEVERPPWSTSRR